MEMIVHLHPEVFDIVLQGKKNVEVRVNDEKRRQLKVGDTLLFLKRPDDVEKIRVKITKLVLFPNFVEVVHHYSMERIYLGNTTEEEYLNIMNQFYKEEDVLKNGVVAIEFEMQSIE